MHSEETNAERDDRPWRAEEMLRAVVGEQPGGGDGDSSTQERIEAFFDRSGCAPKLALDDLGSEHELQREEPTCEAEPRGGEGREQEYPPEPAVTVPNHNLHPPCLGAGGFGQVWLAEHTMLGHHRACKLIPRDKSVELDGLRWLKQRVPAHSNLFPIEDVGRVGDWLYCLMPLADPAPSGAGVIGPGGYTPMTLETYIERNGRRPAREAASIGLELCAGLAHLHTHGVTHGDIKPGNVLRHGGRWALADYGLVRDLASPRGGGHTPGYCPPEGSGSAAADRYALGVVLMQLLTGWRPQRLEEFRSTPIDKLRLGEGGPALAGVIRRAVSENPDERFGSTEEFAASLRPLAESEGTSGAGVRRRVLAAALVVGALGAALWLGQVFRPGRGDTAAAGVAGDARLVDSFEVRHWRYDNATDSTYPLGRLGADTTETRLDDDLTVHAAFTRPAYFYLLSLGADGQVNLRLPASEDSAPEPATGFDYPSGPPEAPLGDIYNLKSPGTYGFLLLVSENELPAWSEWNARHGVLGWSGHSVPVAGVYLFDGHELRIAGTTREPSPRRGQLIANPIDWAMAREGIDDVRFIAFPVLPLEDP